MWGAIIGDIVGSRFEFNNIKTKDFELFGEGCCYTDDTVLTAAVAATIMKLGEIVDERAFKKTLVVAFHKFGKEYLNCGFGARFFNWLTRGEVKPYKSYGNGSAMRVSPVAWYSETLEDAEVFATMSAAVTHNHPEGIKGAQAIAGAIWLAKDGAAKKEIKAYVEEEYEYDLNISLDKLRKREYTLDESCQTTVPIAVKCFLESSDFEDAIRTAVSVGGDSDTIAAITGSIAEAHYGIDKTLIEQAKKYLDERLLRIAEKFTAKFLK